MKWDDVLDIAYAASSEGFRILERPQSALPRAGLGPRSLAYLGHLVQAVNARRVTPPAPVARILFFASSENQLQALRPVADALEASIVGDFSVAPYGFPTWAAYLRGMKSIPGVLIRYVRARGYLRRSMRHFLDQFVVASGYYEVGLGWLERMRPRVVVVANDHNVSNRALVNAARSLSIPVVYLQHAAVTNRFPPLQMDFAFLDGRDALEKYAEAGPSDCVVLLTGNPKTDALVRLRTGVARTIGVCTNRLDDPSVVGAVCLAIRRGYPDAVIELRPHPADKRVEAWRAVALTSGVRFSSATEPSVRFLERVGVVVADGSSILLEAALAGARPINFSFGGSTHDPYGFVLRGVAVKAGDVHELVSVLGSDVSDNGARRRALRFYDASIDSTHEGHATEVAAAAIRRIAGRENAVPATWIRADCQRLEAYSAPAIGDRVSADGSPACR